MIQIYARGNENFQQNGDAVLFCYSCDLQAELNGTWALSMEVPIDKEGRWKLVTEEAVLKVPTWQDDEQLYRIAKVTKTEDGVSAIAYPIFYDSSNDCFLMDVRPTGKTGQEALNIMTADSPYSGESNISTVETAYFVRRNLLSAINGNESPTFIERWGGEILYDNYKVIINDRVGGDYGVEARYGRNIEGVTYVVDTSNIITRIIPVAYNGHTMSGDEPWVDSPDIYSYAKIYTREVRYENIRLAEDASGAGEDAVICADQAELDAALQAAAEADFANGCDAATVTLDIDMAVIRDMASKYTDDLLDPEGDNIADTTEEDILAVWYRDYSSFETVRLGDTIRCRHYKLDITSIARVIAITWDCVEGKVIHITLGDYSYNYVKTISNALNRVNSTIREDGSVVAEKVQGYLDGAQTQLRTQYNLAERQDVMAILFENLDSTSPMYGALGIGTQGICISKTRTADGRDWDWTTGITANGMNAAIGIFGILSDKLGKNWINMDTGELSLSSTALIGGKTIGQYMDEADQALADYAAATDATIAQIQAEIDGQYDTYFEDYAPTLNNYPANEWTTEALKEAHEGDLFYDKSTGNSYRFFNQNGTWEWTLITDTVAAQALALASQAKDTADGKRRVFTAQPVPPYDAGDIYFTGTEILVCVTPKATGGTYAASDFERKDTYNTASEFNQFLSEYTTTISGLQSDIDDRIETWPQSTDPSTNWTAEEKALHSGDIWYNTSTGVMKYWTGSAWSDMTTTPPASVITSINSKATVFTSQPVPPYRVGDLWFDSATADIMTCVTARSSGNYTASDWQKRNKYTDDTAVNTLRSDMEALQTDLQGQLDQKVQTWYQDADPSLDWTATTTEAVQDTEADAVIDTNDDEVTGVYESEKAMHEGDLWHRTTDNTEWRYTSGNWEEMSVPDSLVDELDGKKTIFYGSAPTPPYAVRDLWVQGEDGDILVCIIEKAQGETYAESDWTLASKYTDDSALTAFINGDYADTIEELKEQADGKAETWYQADDPSTGWDDPEVHRGDLWYKTSDQTTWFWNGSAWQQQNVPQAVFDKIDTKKQIFSAQPTIPYYTNDIWFTGTDIKVCTTDRTTGSFVDSDWVKKDYYTDDSALNDFIANEFADLQTETSQKIESWSQASDPSTAWTTAVLKTAHTGDLWYNTTASVQKTYRWTGTAWAEVKSTPPQAVTDTINGKANIFLGSSTPASPKAGDLWMKSANDDILTYVNGEWVKYNKYTDDSSLTTFINGPYAQTIADLQTQEDGKAETWVQTTDPSTAWSTAAEKAKHTGDIWYNTTSSVRKYYMYDGAAWIEMKTEPPAAIMDEIDGKAQVFAVQPTVPYYKNDVWFTGTDIKICVTTREVGSYTASDWVKKDNYTDDSALEDWIAGEYADDLANTQALIDGKIDTWYQPTDPALSWSAADKSKHTGDIWQNSSTQKAYRYTGSAWQEMKTTPPDAVFDRIDSKAQIFSSEPTVPYYVNDLWYTGTVVKVCVTTRTSGSYTASDWQKKDYYTDDSALEEFLLGDYAEDMAAVQNQLDQKIETWYQTNDPSSAWTETVTEDIQDTAGDNLLDTSSEEIVGVFEKQSSEHIGDIWQNPTDDTQWRWNGEWIQMQVPKDLIDTVDGKSAVYVGTDTPSNPQERDLWFKGPEEGVYTYVAGQWVIYNKYTDDENLYDFVDNTYEPKIEEIQTQLDGKVETWFYAYAPTAENLPASEWTTAEDKAKHVGDLFYDITEGAEASYRYSSTFEWEQLTDADITEALESAAKAQDTADHKRTIFTTQPVPPYQVGDMWITGSTETDEIRYCTTARASGEYTASDWIKTPTETKAQATLQALDGEIIAQVIAGDIINAINISSEGTKILASKLTVDATNIDINGVTSINGGFKVNLDGTFEATAGKIGNIHITSNSLYSGSHSTYSSENPGFYLGHSGLVGIGDANSYIRYNPTNGQINIRATSVLIDGDPAATSSALDSAATTAHNEAVAAGKTATDFLEWTAADGLVVSETQKNSSNLLKVQVKSSGINFLNGTRVLSTINGTTFTIYKPGSSNVKSMELLSTGLYFYKFDGTTVASKFTDSGLEIETGKIGGFTIASKAIYTGTLGQANSIFISTGTTGYASIGGSEEINGWVYTAGSAFGVTKTGALYANNATISGKVTVGAGSSAGGVLIGANAIYSTGHTAPSSATAGFYMGSDGQFSVGDGNQYIRFYKQSNVWKLNITVDTLMIGGSTAATVGNVAEAAGTATNYLYYSAESGLVVSNTGTVNGDANNPFNTQITATALNFRSRAKVLMSLSGTGMVINRGTTENAAVALTGTGLTFYRTNGTDIAMSLTDNALTFYGSGSRAGVAVASVGAYGIEVKQGTIGDFVVSNSSNTGTTASGGHVYTSSLYSHASADGYEYEYGLRGGNTRGNIVLYVAQIESGGTWSSPTYITSLTMDGTFTTVKASIGSWIVTDTTISANKISLIAGTAETGAEIALGNFNSTYNVNRTTAYVDSYGNISANSGGFNVLGCCDGLPSKSEISDGWASFIADRTSIYFYQPVYFSGNSKIATAVTIEGVTTHRANIILNGTTGQDNGRVLVKASNGTMVLQPPSSRRYKDIDRPLTEADVEEAYNIGVYRAKYKNGFLNEDSDINGKYMPMLIAEEVEEFLPEAALHENGQVEDWNYRVMIPVMLQMIKDLRNEIKELKNSARV